MNTIFKIIVYAVLISLSIPCIAQNDSITSFRGLEFDLTAFKTKKKLIASTNQIVYYMDTLDYYSISSIQLLKDSVRFQDYGEEIKLNLSDVNKISFKSGLNWWIGILAGIPIGMVIGIPIGRVMDPSFYGYYGMMTGALVGMISGGIIGGIIASQSYDEYYISGSDNKIRRRVMKNIFDRAKIKYNKDL